MAWSWGASSSNSISGFGSSSSAELVTQHIDASRLTAIVTGGTSGIGNETVRILALRGAQVVIAARNVAAGIETKEAILKEIPKARLLVLELDLGSLQSVRKFVFSFKSKGLPLNMLINNGGIMGCPFELSSDGIELQFATNYLGHFLLTNLLLDKMKSTAQETGIEGRIVNVSSILHKFTYNSGIRMHKINEKSGYSPYRAYAQSKLAMILHTNELARRLTQEKANVTANSVHPGAIKTNITRYINPVAAIVVSMSSFAFKSVAQGAATQCYVALHPSLKRVSGKYFVDCNEATPSSFAKDPELAQQLWQFSVQLTSSKEFLRSFREKSENMET